MNNDSKDLFHLKMRAIKKFSTIVNRIGFNCRKIYNYKISSEQLWDANRS